MITNLSWFSFLQRLLSALANRLVLCAFADNVVSKLSYDHRCLLLSLQENADTRMFLFIQDVSRQGAQSVKFKMTFTDFIVITSTIFSNLNLEEFWIELGPGKTKLTIRILKEKRVKLYSFFIHSQCLTKFPILTVKEKTLQIVE